tara:strand:- start:1387 stop:2136 length:750 start_codon:yes stop_codon:yes gene_type:complete
MGIMMRFLSVVALVLAPAVAQAQVDVVLTNSDPVVAVHSNFRGQAVTLFGAIEPLPADGTNYSVVVTVQGPSTDWVVREKERRLGFILNAASTRYTNVPSYYGIFSTSPRDQIFRGGLRTRMRLDLSSLVASLREDGDAADTDPEFLRLMLASGRFSVADRGVVMLSPAAFSLRVPVASDASNGLYLARAFVIVDGEVVGEGTSRFTIRTQGFERYVAEIARSNPPLYGLATLLISLGTGWLGGVLFRR